MSKRKERITAKLVRLGAAWAVTQDKYVDPNDPIDDPADQAATYHVHPDASNPHQGDIFRFVTLDALEEWADGELLLPIAFEAAVEAAQEAGGKHSHPAALLAALDWDGEVLGHTATLMRIWADPWMAFEDPAAAFSAAAKAFWGVLNPKEGQTC